jgi:phosphoserine aminotransferase
MHNFNSGPSVLPREVFEEASQAIINFNDTGLSILEIGHRTKLFQPVLDESIALMKELMQLDNDREVLFLHGGASTQFFQVPMNLLNENEIAAYTDTGVFAIKAIKEAKLFGHIEMVCSSKADNYHHLPKDFIVPKTAKYLHITSNNTIEGTQWHDMSPFYNSGVPLVADMSSDVLSRELDFNKFDIIYGGAQKNVGAAGVTFVVINKNILGKVDRSIPGMLDYRQHIANGSMFNTPPVFAIYVCMLTLRWLKSIGGIKTAEKLSNEKSALLYKTLDESPVFTPTVTKEDRSKMNVCFVANDEKIEKEFLELCSKEGMVGIKGHRSAGGFRASLYNALPLESVEALSDLMKDFAQRKA